MKKICFVAFLCSIFSTTYGADGAIAPAGGEPQNTELALPAPLAMTDLPNANVIYQAFEDSDSDFDVLAFFEASDFHIKIAQKTLNIHDLHKQFNVCTALYEASLTTRWSDADLAKQVVDGVRAKSKHIIDTILDLA